jgi:exosortase H (IPTLxxWG-CTERM-specific)
MSRRKHPAAKPERLGPGRGAGATVRAAEPPARHWLRQKWPIVRFVLVLVVLMGAFHALSATSLFQQRLYPAYMELNASWSAALLRLCGEQATANGANLSTPRFAVQIRRGCEAIEPSVLFAAAAIAFPVSVLARVVGVVGGIVALALVNLLRIVSLYYVGVYWPSAFETAHIDVWQPAFIIIALALWIAWAVWATRPARRRLAQRVA